MRVRNIAGILTIAVLAVAAALTPTIPSARAAGREAVIGFAFSMTGGSAAYGDTQKKGAELAVEEINAAAAPGDIRMTALFDDDASMPQQGVNVFNKFINADRVVLIVGPTLSNTAQVTDRIAQKAGVPVLAISNTAKGITEIGDFIFRDSLTEMVVIPNTIKVAKAKFGLRKVALLYGNDDAYTKGGYDAFRHALQENGIELLKEQTFAKGDRDFAPQLTEIKALNPDAIVVSALVEEASGIVVQARQLGIPETIPIIGGNGFNSPSFIKNAGRAAENAVVGASWFAASTTELNRHFIEAYTTKYGNAPDQFAAQSYAGVHLVHEAVKRAGSVSDRKAVRDALAGIRDLETVLGKFSFSESRDAVHTPVVQVVKNGKFTLLE